MTSRIFILSASIVAITLISGCTTKRDDVQIETEAVVRSDTGASVTDLPMVGEDGSTVYPDSPNAQNNGMAMDAIEAEPVAKFGTTIGTDGPAYQSTSPMRVSSGGSVVVFDLDSNAPVNPVSQNSGGVIANPGVTIFPIDGGAQSGVTPMPSYGAGSGYSPVMSGYSDEQIYFKHGSSRLGSGDKRKLSDLAMRAKASFGQVEIEGHASRPAQTGDPVKDSVLNLKESMNRSFAVSKNLIHKGVPADRIKTVSYGAAKAVDDEKQSRRVDINVQ